MGFIDIENINDNSICDVNYQIKNLIIKPNNGDMNSIYIEIEVEISSSAYEVKSVNLIEDLYSISSDLNVTQKEIIAIGGKKNLKDNCIIKEKINIPEIRDNRLYNAKVIPSILNTSIMNQKIIYEGEISIELLFEINGGINSKTLQIPFDFSIINEDIDENCVVDTDIDIIKEDFIVNSGNIDANIELQFNVNIRKNDSLNIINEILLEETTDNNIYSMVIYFVKPGDTLWKIAKKFKSTIDDIKRINSIEDANKIFVGEQLYIPKVVRKAIAG